MPLLTEECKVDAAIEYQALATPAPGITSRYFKMDRWCKAVFAVIVDTLAAAEEVICEVWEDLVNTGATGAAIGGATPTATATITANTNATVLTATLLAVAVDDTITINGVVFTAAAVADHPNLVFSQAGDDTADALDLATCINAAAGQAALVAAGGAITAAPALAVVTLTASEAGEVVMTVVASATMTIATVQAVALLEVEDTALSAADSWVAINLVGPATANAAVALVRGGSRYGPAGQHVAATDTDE